jgi:hypothetical protein
MSETTEEKRAAERRALINKIAKQKTANGMFVGIYGISVCQACGADVHFQGMWNAVAVHLRNDYGRQVGFCASCSDFYGILRNEFEGFFKEYSRKQFRDLCRRRWSLDFDAADELNGSIEKSQILALRRWRYCEVCRYPYDIRRRREKPGGRWVCDGCSEWMKKNRTDLIHVSRVRALEHDVPHDPFAVARRAAASDAQRRRIEAIIGESEQTARKARVAKKELH